MLLWKYADRQLTSQAPLRVSPECLRRNVGRSLVAANPPGHDVARIPKLQAVPGILRRNRDEHIGGSLAPAGSVWNHRHASGFLRRAKADLLAHPKRHRSCSCPHGNGSLGRQARKNRKSSACPANAKGQAAISGRHTKTLGGKNAFTPYCV